MNNSETQFSIKAVKVEEVICVLRRIIGQLFLQVLGVNHTVRRSREFWLLPKENLNVSGKLQHLRPSAVRGSLVCLTHILYFHILALRK